MSNILIFTDLHGDAFKMHKLEQVYKENNCTQIWFLGDLLYHGPRNDLPAGYKPKEVVNILNSYKENMVWIQGNCDAEVDEMVMGINFSKLKEIEIFNHKFVLTHGHHLKFNSEDCITKGSIVLYGHYHVFDNKKVDGVSYVGIGSPSIPKDGMGQYAILNEETLTIYDINDNVGSIVLELNRL